MRRRSHGVTTAALMALAVGTGSASGQVTASLTPANVSPIFGTWPSLPGQWTMVLTNGRGVIDVSTQVQFTLNGQNVGVAPSDFDVIEAGTTVSNGTQIARWAETAWNGVIGPQVAATGRLPAGAWDLCVEMRDVDAALVANPCGSFSVQPAAVLLTLTAANVTPVLADWSTRPAQFTLIATSNLGQSARANTGIRLLRDGAQVGTTTSPLDLIPNGTSTFGALQIGDWDQFALTGAVAAAVQATGSLPAGQYDACVDLTSANPTPEFPPVTACASFPVAAAGGVTASLILPNPTPYLADWSAVPSVMTLIVTNTTGQRVTASLTMRLLRGDNQVGTAPGAVEDIPASVASTFVSPQIGRWDEFALTGAVAQAVGATGRLPESADYQLCAEFTSLDAGGTALEPVSACAPFAVSFPQPPSLIAPADGMDVTLPYPAFQWTPVVSAATPQVSYLLRVVEVLNGQTPVQAVAANPPFFETAVANVTALLYPPSAFPLEVGTTYAWRVQAVRPVGAAVAALGVQPVGANEGKSEVFTFTRAAPPGPPAAPPPTIAEPPQPWTPYWNAWVTGRLEYSFSKSDVPQPKRVSLALAGPLGYYESMGGPSGPSSPNTPPGFVLPVGASAPPPGGPSFQTASDKRPLAGVPVRLVVRYRTGSGPAIGTTVTINGKTYNDNGKVIATATTGPDGKFLFLFNDDNPTGLIAIMSNVSWGGGDFTTNLQGASVARYYNVEVGEPRYLTPSDEITLDQTKSADVGTLVSLVRSYRMAVLLKRFGTQSAPPPLRVQVLRTLRPATVPKNEGSAPEPHQTWAAGPGIGLAYEILAEQSSGAGVTTFAKLVKNVGPADKYYLRVFSDPDGTTNYYQILTTFARSWALQLGSPKPFDMAYYNEQYQIPTDTLTLVVIPKPPRYLGEVVRTGTADPVASALAVLLGDGKVEQLRVLQAADSGRFVFENLKSSVGYRVSVYAAGFKPDSFTVGNLSAGQQVKHVHVMQPDAYVRGRVVDETGAPLFARVRVADGPEVETQPIYQGKDAGPGGMILAPIAIGPPGAPPPAQNQALFAGNLMLGAKQQLPPSSLGPGTSPVAPAQIPEIAAWQFETFASSGTRTVQVDPGPKYLPLDTSVTIPAGSADLGVFKLYRALHRMRLRVLVQPPQLVPGCTGTPIPGAVVQLAVAGAPTDTADGQGYVEFAWEAPTNDVTARIFSPPDQDFVYAEPGFTVPVGKTPVQRCTRLLPAGRIGGMVYAGTGDSVPVANARVFVAGEGPLYDGLQDSTDAEGKYLIRGVPPGTDVKVRAGKSASQFVGDSLMVSVVAGQTTTANFHLRYYDGMDITQLLGFSIEVLSLTEVQGGAVIGGAVPAVPSHPVFGFETPGATLEFDSVTIVPKGAADSSAVPAAGRVLLNDNTLSLQLFGSSDFLARHYAPATGLQIRDRGDGVGAVVGPVELLPQSFTAVTPAELSFVTAQQQPVALHLLMPGATGEARTRLPSFTADGASNLGADGFDVGTADGAAAPFRLFQFTADADPVASALKGDGLHLAATVHTAIPGVADLALKVPDLLVVPGQGSGKGIKYPLSGEQQIQATLGQWTLAADAWSIGQGTIHLSKGKIVARLVPSQPSTATDFPFLGMKLTPTTLSGGQFGNGPVLLGGIAPMGLPEALVFGRDGDTGPWKLVGQNAVIGGLPGMRSSDKLDLGIVIFRSNGEKSLSLKNGVLVQLYGTADYAVTGLAFDEKSVSLVGTLDLKVPGLPTKGADVFYTREGSTTKYNMVPASWDPIDVNGAQLRIINGAIDSTGFHADAQVSVPNKFMVLSRFDRTPFTGSNLISAPPKPEGSIDVGQLKIGGLSGGAAVANGAWDVAWDGTLAVGDEMSGNVSVSVEGANITAGSAGFSVKKVSTPFGDLTIVLDFATQEIIGTLQFAGDLGQGLYANGAAELVMSGKPQDRYWYFFAGANFSLNAPKLSGVAALVIGNTLLKDQLLDKFDDYSTKGVPEVFRDIEGFFLEGNVSIPLPFCPSGGVDIGVASVGVWCNVWADLRLGMNFNELNIYHIGQLIGIGAGVEASFGLGLCVSVWGSVSVDFDFEGEYRSDGAWYVWGQENIGLNGGAEFGVGVDDVCLDKGKSFTIDLGVEAQLGTNFNTGKASYYSVYFK